MPSTVPMAGYGGADEYYRAASVDQRLQQIAVPVLVLQGSNDPWVPVPPCLSQPVPRDPLTGISVVVTRGGGHVGFHDSRLNWHIRATLADGTAAPANQPKWARTALLASRTNVMLSIPMLFFMVAAIHLPRLWS